MRERLRCCPGETQPRESRLHSTLHAAAFHAGPRTEHGLGRAESFQVLAGDGRHDVLWVVDGNGLKVRVPACLPAPPLPAAYAIHSRQVLKLTYIRARQAHYPVTDRSSNTVPPLVAQYHPKRRRSSVAAQVFRRKTEETPEMDTMELDTTVLPVDAMGRFWGRFLFHVFHDYNRLMYRWCWCSRVCAARGDPAVEVPDPC